MKKITNYLKVACICLAFIPVAVNAEKLKVLIIDGQNNHNWKSTTLVLKEALDSSGVFVATVITIPPKKTKCHEPMVLTVNFGKGRILHTPLGHDVEAMRCRSLYELLQRGAEWAISGEVVKTAEVPSDFPTAKKTSSVPAATK